MKNKRYIIAVLVMISGLFILAACGKEKETTSGEGIQSEYKYVAELKDIDFKVKEINDGFVYENQVYVTGSGENGQPVLEIYSLEGGTIKEIVLDNGNIAYIEPDGKGNIVYLSIVYDEESGTGSTLLGKIDSNGSKLMEVDILEDVKQSQSGYVSYLSADQHGNLYASTDNNKILLYNGDGEYQGMIGFGKKINSMTAANDGLVYVTSFIGQELAISPIDFAKKSAGNAQQSSIAVMTSPAHINESDKQLLASDTTSLVSVDIAGNVGAKVLDWVECGIDGKTVRNVSPLNNGNYFVLTTDYLSPGESSKIIILKKTLREDIAEKITLTYGTVYLDPGTEKKIIEFNQSSDKYFIEIKSYDVEKDPGAPERMTVDIIAGNGPDIIDMKMNEAEKIMRSGALEDLYPYMEKDAEINPEDYLENVLKTYERGGKLYAVSPFFAIRSMVGKTKNVGEEMGWTLEDMKRLWQKHPDAELFKNATANEILQLGIRADPFHFIDWETGNCNFQSEEFIELLEFANEFGTEMEAADFQQAPDQLRSEKYLLEKVIVSSMTSYRGWEYSFGEDVTFVGYPVSKGTGSRIETLSSFAINSKSENKEAAWEFIKVFFELAYQSKDFGMFAVGFPIRKDALELLMEREMLPETEVDEMGNEIKIPKSTWAEMQGQPPIEIYEATKEEMEEFKAFILSGEGLYDYNIPVINIVSEETAAYFEGQKTAEEAAKIIQSRMTVYLNENR